MIKCIACEREVKDVSILGYCDDCQRGFEKGYDSYYEDKEELRNE